jgi:hypothetical protein
MGFLLFPSTDHAINARSPDLPSASSVPPCFKGFAFPITRDHGDSGDHGDFLTFGDFAVAFRSAFEKKKYLLIA